MRWRYDLDVASQGTRFAIFDATGQLVRSMDLGPRPARSQVLSWDGTNQAGRLVSSGVYYGVLDADGRRGAPDSP